jgi:hypothetical protein
MPFEGLGQALYDDAKMIGYIEVYSLLLSKNETTIEDIIAKMHITEEEFYLVANEIKSFSQNDEHEAHRQFMQFRINHQDILQKMKEILIT